MAAWTNATSQSSRLNQLWMLDAGSGNGSSNGDSNSDSALEQFLSAPDPRLPLLAPTFDPALNLVSAIHQAPSRAQPHVSP